LRPGWSVPVPPGHAQIWGNSVAAGADERMAGACARRTGQVRLRVVLIPASSPSVACAILGA
jgi:hypothetical protein